MTRLPLSLAALTLAAALPMIAAAPALAQTRGGGGGGELAINLGCQPGNITCIATYDASCRESGGFMTLRKTMASAVTMECTSDRARLDAVFREEGAQTTTCTSGHLCLRQGTRTGNETNIYRQVVGMMNTCLRSQGVLEVHAILADGPNTSTAYAGCLPRA